VVLCLSQDGACTDFFENFRDNSLKGGLSNATTFNPPLFSLVDTFKEKNFSHFLPLHKREIKLQNVPLRKRRKFAGMLYKLDESVGIVVDKLKEFFIPIQFYKSILNLHFVKTSVIL
jgi:hypothetical protein